MTGTLFDDQPSATPVAAAASGPPLAERIRPRTLEEVVGQEHLLGSTGFLAEAIAQDRIPSVVFWGPPGSGKTTLARLIASYTARRFVPFSAVTAGIREVKQVMSDAVRLRRASGRSTVLFIDEIHRFNRAQQDAFLPYVESGAIVLVGATTENPSFELNSALLSRCRVIVLEPLDIEALIEVMQRALDDSERGLGDKGVRVAQQSLEAIAKLASGDARRALNLLELGVEDALARGVEELDPGRLAQLAQRRVLLYDKAGEEHFNLISAFHKSLRESDPDAALYWLARMLASGEDPLYVARRMVRMASEDVGLADPKAVSVALTGWEAYRRLGSPEGDLALAEVAIYLSLAPKSNALYRAWGEARGAVEAESAEPVPMALRNAPTRLMSQLGYGEGYVYAHDTEEGVGGLECLPPGLAGRSFYRPGEEGFELRLRERLQRFRSLRARARQRRAGG